MPRKPRIEIAGYYHIVNRGVEQRTVFKEAEDYEYPYSSYHYFLNYKEIPECLKDAWIVEN